MAQQDEFAGHGGSYLIDKDGKKTLVHRTAPVTETAAVDAAVAVPEKPVQKKAKQ